MVGKMARSPFPPILIAALLAGGLAACDRPQGRAHREHAARHAAEPLRVVDRLQCPGRQGSLRLVTTAADGHSCDYEGANGSRVVLRIVPLDGSAAEAALAPIEAELKARLPARAPQSAAAAAEGESGDVNINMPGINIDANDDGANIRIGGLHVNADEEGAAVRLDPVSDTEEADEDEGADSGDGPVVRRLSGRGDVTIDADDRGAEIRISAPGRGVRMTYVLASSQAGPEGDRLVAYEARGPIGGPLVVATLRSRSDQRAGPIEPMKRLVRLNVGG